MPSPSDVAELRAANESLSRRVEADLRGFWASLDLSQPERARDALLEFVPALTTVYGEGMAAVAADWYDEMRAAEAVPGRFRAEMAAAFPAEYVEARVRYGAGHLFTDAPNEMLSFLSGAVQEYVLQPGRDTVARSTLADPRASGWHRETRGEACGFCRMLAGRGGVYKEATASFASHGHCNCVAAPSWDADAPEVPAVAYVASQRMDSLRRQASGEPVTLSRQRQKYLARRGLTAQEDAQRQLAAHRARVRAAIEEYGD